MKQKKVMILGAGAGQLPFINICKSKGYYVIAVSIPGDYPGFKIADKFYFIDTRNKEKILKVALEEKIDAILTDQTDVSVPTVAYVAEKMGLRGIGYNTALVFTNKFLMRKAAIDAGIDVPEFDKAKNTDEAINVAKRIGFPVVIKPADSSGSRGVFKITCEKELIEKFNTVLQYSTTDYIVVEKFITGKEYLVDGFAMDKKYINLDLGVKEFFDKPNVFVSSMCMFSSAKRIDDPVGLKILDSNSRFIESVNLQFGITHAEFIYNEDEDKVYLVEIAARGGGVYLSSDITPTATGFDSNRLLIDYVVENKQIDLSTVELDKKIAAWKCFSFPEGEIIEISGVEETKNIQGVFMLDMSGVYVGKKTVELCDDSEKYGPALIVANNDEDCYKTIEKIKKTLKIKIRTANGISGIIW